MFDKTSEKEQIKPPPDIDINDANMLVSDEELSDDPYYLKQFSSNDKEAEIWNTELRAIKAHGKVYGPDGYRSWLSKEMGWNPSIPNSSTDPAASVLEGSGTGVAAPVSTHEQTPLDTTKKRTMDSLDGDIGGTDDELAIEVESEHDVGKDTGAQNRPATAETL